MFTPGPWETRNRKDGLVNVYVAGTEFDISLCSKPEDATLISLAPEMYELLKDLCGEYGFRNISSTNHKKLVDLLNKIDGR